MADPVLVSVIYRGIPLLAAAPLRDLKPAESPPRAFVQWDAPLPVGTPLEIKLPSGETFSASVRSVVEAEPGAGAGPGPGPGPGMTLDLDAAAADVLRALAAADASAAPVAPASPEDTSRVVA